MSYAGPFAGARGKLAAGIVRARLKETHGIKYPHRIDVIGLSSDRLMSSQPRLGGS
jgi:hypothetical protein